MRGPRPRTVLLLVAFLAAAPFCAASRPLLTVDTLVGFNGVAREDRFSPVVVSVENPGPAATVEVRIDLSWGSSLRGDQGTRTYARSVILSPGGLRRLSFVVPLRAEARTLATRITRDGEILAAEDVDLRGLTTARRLFVAISSDYAFDTLAGLGASEAARIAYPRMDDLPDAWAGYDGADAVIVHDTYAQQTVEGQREALRGWVVRGGTLVFTGGVESLQHASAGFADLLPVEVTGLHEGADVGSLAALVGVRSGPRGTAVVAEARVISGRALASSGDLPLVVDRPFGKGHVWFLAFDPTVAPFAGWEGTLPLWRLVANHDSHSALGAALRSPLDDPRLKAMLGSPPMGFPPVPSILVFALCYVGGIVFLAFTRLARRMKPALRVALLVAFPAAACVAGWLVFARLLLPASPQVLDAGVLRSRAGDGFAELTERIALSATRPADCGLSWPSRQLVVDEVGPAIDRAAEGFTLSTTEGTGIDHLRLPRFGFRLLVLDDVVPFEFDARVRSGSAGTEITMTNDDARELRGCFVWLNGKSYAMGDVPPGASRTSRLGSDTTGAAFADGRRAALWNAESAMLDATRPVVAGWIEGPAMPVRIRGAAVTPGRPALTLVLVEAQ